MSRIQIKPDPERVLVAASIGLYVKKPNAEIEILEAANDIMQSDLEISYMMCCTDISLADQQANVPDLDKIRMRNQTLLLPQLFGLYVKC